MNYMSYGYPTPNQSGFNSISPMSTPKIGSCCGTTAPTNPIPTPYPAQQWTQGVTMQQPVALQQPMATQQPAAMQQPMATQQPAAMQQPMATQQPAAMQQPMAMQQPAAMQQPMPLPQPIAMQQAAGMPPLVSSGNIMTPSGEVLPLPQEQSFIENILRLNIGKVGTFYMTYENNSEWNAKVFIGKIEAAGRDHLIISDVRTGQRIVLLMVNFDYATFDEPLNYQYPFRQPESTEEEQ